MKTYITRQNEIELNCLSDIFVTHLDFAIKTMVLPKFDTSVREVHDSNHSKHITKILLQNVYFCTNLCRCGRALPQ